MFRLSLISRRADGSALTVETEAIILCFAHLFKSSGSGQELLGAQDARSDREFIRQARIPGSMHTQRSRYMTRIVVLVGLFLGLASAAGCASMSWPAAAVADAPAVAGPSPTAAVTQAPPPTVTPTPVLLTATPTATRTRTPTFTATAVPSPTPTPTPTPGLPVRLRIPAIGVDAWIEPVGLTKDQAMGVPSRWEDVGWFRLGYRPGEVGNAVIAGHLDTNTGAPAVFWDLDRLQPGDEIIVVADDGVERVFVVQGADAYEYDQAPVQRIFGPAERPRLNLITCDGAWNRRVRNYSHRLVVYAVAAPREAPDPSVPSAETGSR